MQSWTFLYLREGSGKEEYLKSPCDVFDIVDMLVHI
jgi:hypothetical protein